MSLRMLYIVSCLFLCSCKYETLKFSDEFSPEQIEEMLLGSDDWCNVGVRCFDYQIVTDNKATVKFGTEHCKNVPKVSRGCTHNNKIYFRRDIELEKLRIIFTHELGHVIRKKRGHLKGKHNIMYETTDYANVITELDVKFVLQEI